MIFKQASMLPVAMPFLVLIPFAFAQEVPELKISQEKAIEYILESKEFKKHTADVYDAILEGTKGLIELAFDPDSFDKEADSNGAALTSILLLKQAWNNPKRADVKVIQFDGKTIEVEITFKGLSSHLLSELKKNIDTSALEEIAEIENIEDIDELAELIGEAFEEVMPSLVGLGIQTSLEMSPALFEVIDGQLYIDAGFAKGLRNAVIATFDNKDAASEFSLIAKKGKMDRELYLVVDFLENAVDDEKNDEDSDEDEIVSIESLEPLVKFFEGSFAQFKFKATIESK